MRKAFTLNELLIAMAIIGVILILAIPRVISDMDKKSYVVALQTNYMSISTAVKLLLVDERAKRIEQTYLYATDAAASPVDSAGTFMKKYLKLKKDCGTDPTGCFADSYINLDNAEIIFIEADKAYCGIMQTNAAVCIAPPTDDDVGIGSIWLDVNGVEKPNIAGRDLFLIYIYNNGFVGDKISALDTALCKQNQYGSGCFNRIVNSGWVMDY